MEDCIFCRIAKGEVKSKVIYQDEQAIAFPDINPKAPVHILVVPRKHIVCVSDLAENEEPLMGHLVNIANRLARENGISTSGYRLVINCGPEGGQIVPHLHVHLLGGRQMGKLG
jgi:histidine triad (HIT) family protein